MVWTLRAIPHQRELVGIAEAIAGDVALADRSQHSRCVSRTPTEMTSERDSAFSVEEGRPAVVCPQPLPRRRDRQR